MSTKVKGEMALYPRSEGQEFPGDHGRLHERLARGLLLADGAIGTMLHAKGLQAGEPPELWNVTRPRVVQGVHKAYLAVGCDLVETNTFGANHLRLKESRLAEQTAAINLRAVQLARKVCTAGHLVAGAVGPTGRFSKGKGTASVTEIVSAFKEQVSHLIQGGVDLILVETMTHLAEARMALQATRECPPVPVAVSLVFSEQRGGGSVPWTAPHPRRRSGSSQPLRWWDVTVWMQRGWLRCFGRCVRRRHCRSLPSLMQGSRRAEGRNGSIRWILKLWFATSLSCWLPIRGSSGGVAGRPRLTSKQSSVPSVTLDPHPPSHDCHKDQATLSVGSENCKTGQAGDLVWVPASNASPWPYGWGKSMAPIRVGCSWGKDPKLRQGFGGRTKVTPVKGSSRQNPLDNRVTPLYFLRVAF